MKTFRVTGDFVVNAKSLRDAEEKMIEHLQFVRLEMNRVNIQGNHYESRFASVVVQGHLVITEQIK